MAVTKAKEKEMKEEKEAERQVCIILYLLIASLFITSLTRVYSLVTDTKDQGQAIGKGREGKVRQNGRKNAQETHRAIKEERKAEQTS
jgi:hypothetical protein